ncbi:DNA-3-methyladenine glycosylase I [Acidisoma silvae]|uniref:DNA-3-methyladenine glycosylase I n=1 Tax=Acidisoma silvae TaxID=2802396 RepID=A0A963YRX3_9PROT|nr:DNA-3-methyladenine glycosylase I [Acidisoma silvae]MCB8875872.1 DNA-3-methyladenine glycosylase I [Acidisoma silvae]
MSATMIAPDGKPRCAWCAIGPDMLAYHDREWGFPVGDDRLLFEKFCLEGFQSGLSWRTILTKRDNFRAAFHDFEIACVAAMTEADIARLLQNDGIIRNRAKIASAINNAHRAQELIAAEGSLAGYVWRFAPKAEITPETMTTSPESVALSKDLKTRGWSFVGPTTVFALMQALGLVNDHAYGCVTRQAVASARAGFTRPR